MTCKEKLLEMIREEPGITMVALFQRSGYQSGDVWEGMSALQQEGKVKRMDKGWRVVDRAQ